MKDLNTINQAVRSIRLDAQRLRLMNKADQKRFIEQIITHATVIEDICNQAKESSD